MFSIIVAFLCSTYILYLFYLYNYLELGCSEKGEKNLIDEIDIVIPFRNEEKYLQDLYYALDTQLKCSKIRHKVFWVNDHSEDNGQSLLLALVEDSERHKIINLPEEIGGKKEALTYIRQFVNASYVLCLDGDVTLPANYLQELISMNGEPDLVIGGLSCNKPDGFIEGFAACEHLLLQFLTNAQIKAGTPVLANGANLLMKRDVFLNTLYNYTIKSGDDMDVLNYCLKNNRIISTRDFLKAAVIVEMPQTLNQFLQQRVRWVKKVFLKFNLSSFFTGMLLSTRHILFILFIIRPSILVGIYLLLSVVMEYVILSKMNKYLSIEINKRTRIYFLFLFSIYFLLMPVFAITYSNELRWKGRKIEA